MTEIVPGAGYATFINTFRCDPPLQDEVVAINIDIVDQVATHFPGFISAAAHRSSDGTRVFNYLQW
jgi:Antibiotic biosynthesis monooxygenase